MQIAKEQIQQGAEAVWQAYAKMIKRKVVLNAVESEKVCFKDFLEKFKEQPARIIVMVYFVIYSLDRQPKEVTGHSVLVFEARDDSPLDEDQRSYMAEAGNILIGAYLGSLSGMTGENLRASIQPVFKSTPAEAARILENQLFRGDKEQEMNLTEINLQDLSRAKQGSASGQGQLSLYIFLK